MTLGECDLEEGYCSEEMMNSIDSDPALYLDNYQDNHLTHRPSLMDKGF